MIELLCVDVDGTLTDGSLVYGYSWVGNSSLDKHSADLGFFGVSQTQSLVSTTKNPKNYESHTENPSVVLNANLNAPDSSLQDSPKQSKNSPSLAEGDKGGGLKAQNNSSAKLIDIDSTHPLAPSAREGEQSANPSAREGEQSANPSAMVGGQNVKSGAISQKAEFTEIAKVFNVKDGLALAYWRKKLNRKVAIITGRSSEILKIRANELGIGDLLFMNVRDKGEVLRELKQRFALDLAQIAAVGDDLNDISMFNESHLNFAPNDCASAFKDGALKSLPNITILNAKGGCGAVREAIEMILQKEQIYEKFIQYWQ